MKKMQKILIVLLALVMAFALCACTAPTVQVQNEDGSLTVVGILAEQTVNSLSKLVQMAFFALAAFAADKLGKNLKLKNLNIAVQKVCDLARQTAGELQQTIVGKMKSATENGKLTQADMDELSEQLHALVRAKLDKATQELIIASGADLDALITGACEEYLNHMKTFAPSPGDGNGESDNSNPPTEDADE